MSKAENAFLVIKDRQIRKVSAALHAACDHIVSDCGFCPLYLDEQCAEKQLPPGVVGVIQDKHSACSDWVSLHFRGETK